MKHKKNRDRLREETELLDRAHAEDEVSVRPRSISEYSTPMRTHLLMIGVCVAGIALGLSLVRTINSSRFIVDNQTRMEISEAIIKITDKIKSSGDLGAATVLEHGGVITDDYATTLEDSAFAVLTCSRKIHGEPTFNEIQRFGPNSVKVVIINDMDEAISLLMAKEEGWKIDSISCKDENEEVLGDRSLG